MTINVWWGGLARRSLDSEIQKVAMAWQIEAKGSPEIEAFDRHSRLKVALLYATTLACLLFYTVVSDHLLVGIGLMLVMGLFSIPYTRIFMHSQMHWGMGGGRLTRFLLDHFISLQFGVPQTGYTYGHRFHHRYDNDFDEKGRPRDLQSTYVFSRDGRPTNPVLWLLFYVLVYQHGVHAWLVLSGGRAKDILSYFMELAAIVGFHAGLFLLNPAFYLKVYLPALLIAWLASSIVLYMMHAVDANHYSVHPTNNSHSGFFNSFGDNDGFHLEHTLFPSLHPIYLARMHSLISSDPAQNLKDHYVFAFFRRLFSIPAREKDTDVQTQRSI